MQKTGIDKLKKEIKRRVASLKRVVAKRNMDMLAQEANRRRRG
jgi:hypothetical protein